MTVSAKEFYESLLTKAGVAPEKRQALITQLEDPDVAKALADDAIAPRLRHDEFSRQADEARAAKQKSEAEYAQLLQWQATEQKKIDDFWTQYQAANGNAGNGNGDGTRTIVQPVQGDFLDKKTFESELAKRDQQFVSLLKDGMGLASRHTVEFKEALDTEALAKIAVEKNLTLRQAYDEMVAPRRTEAQKAQFDAQLKAAREEGARDFAATHQIPVDTRSREQHMIFDRPAPDTIPAPGPARDQMLRKDFMDAWNTASDAGTSTQ